MTGVGETLYQLLPALYRERDEGLGGPLRALLRIVGEQGDVLEEDIWQLWNNFFIETCEPWAAAYIGDLVGTTPLFDGSRVRQPETAKELFPDLQGHSLLPEVALRGRADVAKTIYYRRRKGTLPMLEELARDVTGWGARAVEFFELLGWTQAVRNHLRMHAYRTPDVRSVERLGRLDGPFDEVAHTVDVRAIGQQDGWHNVKNVGLFLWRLRSFELKNVPARRVGGSGDYRYHLSALGNPAPLFTQWRREGDEAGLATELHVPGPIRPSAFRTDPSDFVGPPDAPDRSLSIVRDGIPVPTSDIRCLDLSTWRQPSSPVVGVDVRRGRVAFGAGLEPAQGVDAFFHYGFSASLGGGPYPRTAWLVSRSPAVQVIEVDQDGGTPGSVPSLAQALALWEADKRNTIISIRDSRTYEETSVSIEPADGHWLAIEAADQARPHLRLGGPLEITGDHPDAVVTLSGLLVEGWVRVTGSLGRFRVLHTTLVPGRGLTDEGLPATTDPSVLVEPGTPGTPLNDRFRLEAAFSITGPVRVPEHAVGMWILDSIVDGAGSTAIAGPGASDAPGPAAWLERVTVLGPTFVKEATMASEVIFEGPVAVSRQQRGCVRFSFVPPESLTPRRYRCQPDLEAAARIEDAERKAGAALPEADRDAIRSEVAEWLVPSFTSVRYGMPAYAQLHLACPGQIRTGAEDRSEVGAFCHLKQPQREANLRLRLDEYLPFGLEAGLIYVT